MDLNQAPHFHGEDASSPGRPHWEDILDPNHQPHGNPGAIYSPSHPAQETATKPQIWPENLLAVICNVIQHNLPPTRAPDFAFDMSFKSEEKNLCLLVKSRFNLSCALAAQEGTAVSYGSEFRPVDILGQVFNQHPNWQRMC